MIPIPFNNSYLTLGEDFSLPTRPTPVAAPELIKFNHELAEALGLNAEELDSEEGVSIFSGNHVAEGSDPIAMAYAGHQFGGFSPQLGDGRAIQLGEVIAPSDIRYDIQLKGSGPTGFSRSGDGRAALGPVLREYLLSEAMAKLHVPTTRALAVVTTGEEVARSRLLPGGIITRVATSFIRVGTFQYFYANGNHEAIKKLADYLIERNYPEAKKSEEPYAALLEIVIDRQASLIAKWMQLGFIHGVMNTDNMSLAGETIDYGPCAFMDEFDHNRVYSSIDHQGRYAYGNQPSIGQWNLVRFAETILPLLNEDENEAVEMAQNVLKKYIEKYQQYWLEGMRLKLGLLQAQDNDGELMDDFLNMMAGSQADFTLSFYYLSLLDRQKSEADKDFVALFSDQTSVEKWLENWRQRLESESASDDERQAAMQTVNPVYIPRNHQIEAVIRAAEDHHDFSLFHGLYDILQKPYEVQQGKEQYMLPPRPEEVVQQTFCGT